MAIEIFHKSRRPSVGRVIWYAKTHACIILLPQICAVSITNGPTMWIDTAGSQCSAFTSGSILSSGKYALLSFLLAAARVFSQQAHTQRNGVSSARRGDSLSSFTHRVLRSTTWMTIGRPACWEGYGNRWNLCGGNRYAEQTHSFSAE